jgi:hypothetical protein
LKGFLHAQKQSRNHPAFIWLPAIFRSQINGQRPNKISWRQRLILLIVIPGPSGLALVARQSKMC